MQIARIVFRRHRADAHSGKPPVLIFQTELVKWRLLEHLPGLLTELNLGQPNIEQAHARKDGEGAKTGLQKNIYYSIVHFADFAESNDSQTCPQFMQFWLNACVRTGHALPGQSDSEAADRRSNLTAQKTARSFIHFFVQSFIHLFNQSINYSFVGSFICVVCFLFYCVALFHHTLHLSHVRETERNYVKCSLEAKQTFACPIWLSHPDDEGSNDE